MQTKLLKKKLSKTSLGSFFNSSDDALVSEQENEEFLNSLLFGRLEQEGLLDDEADDFLFFDEESVLELDSDLLTVLETTELGAEKIIEFKVKEHELLINFKKIEWTDIKSIEPDPDELTILNLIICEKPKIAKNVRKKSKRKIINELGEVLRQFQFDSPEMCWELSVQCNVLMRRDWQRFFEENVIKSEDEFFQWNSAVLKLTGRGLEQKRDLFLTNSWVYFCILTHFPLNLSSVKWCFPITSFKSILMDDVDGKPSVLLSIDAVKARKMTEKNHLFSKGHMKKDTKRFVFPDVRERALFVRECMRLYFELTKNNLLVEVIDSSLPDTISVSENADEHRTLQGRFQKLRKEGKAKSALKEVKWIPSKQKNGIIEWKDPDKKGRVCEVVVACSEDKSFLKGKLKDEQKQRLFVVITENRNVMFLANTVAEKNLWLQSIHKAGLPLLKAAQVMGR